jgi:uncharacterized protein YbaR (Trm112 family)
MTFHEQREEIQRKMTDEITVLMREKHRRLKEALKNVDLTKGCKPVFSFYLSEIELQDPSKISPTHQDELLALQKTEAYYIEHGIPIPPNLVELRKELTN